MVYATIVHFLMEYQTTKPFLVVMDEFNCYYNDDPGQYFHREYDPTVKKSIPYQQISLFQPLLNAMQLKSRKTDPDYDTETYLDLPKTSIMKHGGFVVGITESRAVPRRITDNLTSYAKQKMEATTTTTLAANNNNNNNNNDNGSKYPFYVVDVPHFSKVEVDHIVSNFEATGIGNLRNDQGETVRNEQQVAYLRMVSGGVGQKLLDACCW